MTIVQLKDTILNFKESPDSGDLKSILILFGILMILPVFSLVVLQIFKGKLGEDRVKKRIGRLYTSQFEKGEMGPNLFFSIPFKKNIGCLNPSFNRSSISIDNFILSHK